MCMSSSLFLGTSQSEEEVSFWLLQCLQKSLWPHVRNLTQCWPQRIPQAERGEEVQLFTLLLFLSGLQALPLSILYYGFLYVYVQFVHRLASLECVCDQPWIGFLDIWNPCKSVLFQIKKKKKRFYNPTSPGFISSLLCRLGKDLYFLMNLMLWGTRSP